MTVSITRRSKILEYAPLSRIRRNHGLEHAALHVLAERHPGKPLAGHSDLNGFWITFGQEVPSDVLTPWPPVDSELLQPYAGRYTIGTAEGDIHDLGKNIVKTMLEVSGFEVTDLGIDVSPARFVENVVKLSPHIIGVSALLTVSLEGQKKLIEALRSAGLREKVKVMIGGAPVTEEWSREIGADGCGGNALTAVRVAKQLISKEAI